MSNIFNKINQQSIETFRRHLAMTGASEASIKRFDSSLRKFLAWTVSQGYVKESPLRLGKGLSFLRIPNLLPHLPKFTNSQFPIPNSRNFSLRAYRVLPTLTIVNFAVVLLFIAGLGFGVYQQFIAKAPEKLAYPAAPVTPKRYLSFQGRLTNTSDTPITGATNFVFKLYDASSGGNTLWNSGTCSIDPDEDGVFNTILGLDCGTEITSTVFSENSQVWLGVTIGSDAEATPRIQIATVAFALNAETLQGFPIASATNATAEATMGATARTIPALNPAGNLVIAAASPTLWSTSGTFGIKGQTLSIVTDTGTNGNVTIAPDGTGVLNLSLSGGTGNVINATDANLGSSGGKEANTLLYGKVQSDATNYNLLKLESGSTATPKFTVDYAGNASMAGALNVLSTITANTNETVNGIDISSGTISDALWNGAAIGVGYGGLGGDVTPAGAGEILYSTGVAAYDSLVAGTTGYILQSNGAAAPSWVDISSTGGPWTVANGTIYPDNSTLDLLIGGTASTSADFAFLNVNSGTPIASFSGNLTLASTPGTVRTISSTNNTPLAINPTGGNVGIGTTTPTQKLDVSGNFHITGYVNSDAGPYYLNGQQVLSYSGTDVYINANPVWQTLGLRTNNLTRMHINPSGAVGIGTTTPNGQLQVTTSGVNAALVLDQSGTGNILSASSSGTQKFYITNDGSLNSSGYATVSGSLAVGYSSVLAGVGNAAFAGKVGIGTTSPLATLDVTGTASVSSNLYMGSSIRPANSPLSFDYKSGANTWATAMTIANNGYVGIGTTNPEVKFQIAGTAEFITGNGTLSKLRLTQTGQNNWDLAIPASTSRFEIQEAGTPMFTIAASTGNVGIGTTNPSYKLDVVGNASVSGNLMAGGQLRSGQFANAPLAAGGGSLYYNSGNSTLYVSDGSSWTALGGGTSAGWWQRNNGALSPLNISDDLLIGSTATTSANFAFLNSWGSTPTASFSGNLTLASTPGTVRNISSTNNTPLSLNPSGGNVGIGTTGPSEKLFVSGNAGITGKISVGASVYTGEAPYILARKNDVAIVLDPSSLIAMEINDQDAFLNILTNSAYDGGISFGDEGDNNIGRIVYDHGTNKMSFYTNDSQNVVIDNTGNVGIGTTTPLGALHIDKNSGVNATLIVDQDGSGDIISASSSGVRKFYITNDGSLNSSGYATVSGSLAVGYAGVVGGVGNAGFAGMVGIGTSNPAYSLDVTGNIRATGTTTFGGLTYTWPGSQTTNYYLQTNASGTLSWADVTTNPNAGPWSLANGVIYPDYTTADVLIGGSATSSANFGFINNLTGTPTATFSGNLVLASTPGTVRTISSTNNTPLSLNPSGGNVGIGTTGPAGKLDVQGGYTYLNGLRLNGADAGDNNIYADASIGIAVANGAGKKIYLKNVADATKGITLDADSGNVGIGTTTPLGALHIDKNSGVNATLIVDQDGSGDIISASSSGVRKFYITNDGSLNSSGYATVSGSLAVGYAGVVGGVGNAGFAGSVGIGTSNPSSKLQVAGNITPSTTSTYDLGSSALYWNNLYVNNLYSGGSGTSGFWIQDSGSLYPRISSVDLLIGGTATTSAKFAFINNLTGTPTATFSGNLVLASTPGTVRTISSTNNTPLGINPTGGNVGIGTTTPSNKLSVSGDSDISGSLAINGATVNSARGINIDYTNEGADSYGVYNTLNTNNFDVYGMYNSLTVDTASEEGFGVYNNINASVGATGLGYGVYNLLTNGGNLYGVYNDIYTTVAGGYNYGVYTEVGAGGTSANAYGAYNILRTGADSAKAYGTYIIDAATTTDGTQYGLYVDLDNTLTNNNYSVYVESGSGLSYFGSNVGIGTTTPVGTLHIDRNSGGNATLIVDQDGVGNIMAASSSGTSKFFITNDGSLNSSGYATVSGSLAVGYSSVLAGTGNAGFAGMVGIGTSNPAYSLDVTGNIRATGTTTFGGLTYTWPGSQTANYYLQTNGSGTLSWADVTTNPNAGPWSLANGVIYPDYTTADVLIGGSATSSANFGFINNLTGTPTATFSGNLVLASVAGTNRTIGTTNMNPLTLGTSTTGNLVFAPAGSTAMTITQAGNIGIGTTGPSKTLDVVGQIITSDYAYLGGTTSTGLRIKGSDNENTIYQDQGNLSITAATGNKIYLSQVSSPTTGLTVDTTSGNVGIGTTTPLGALHIDKNSGVNATLIVDQDGSGDIISASSSGTRKFYITNDGSINSSGYATVSASLNVGYGGSGGLGGVGGGVFSGSVGIGTSNPSGKLQVVGDEVRIGDSGTPSYATGDGDMYIEDTLEVGTALYVAGSQIVNYWQRASGALSPTNITDDLLLGATATSSALVKLTGTSGNNSWINTGNLGIGTTGPAEQLEITGNFRLPTTTSTTGIIKAGTSTFLHNYGTNNTYLGVSAGNLTLTGTDNTGVGKEALAQATTGSRNTTLGYRGLYSLTTSSDNTVFGYQALNSNATAEGKNVAIGVQALYTNTGSFNTAVGYQALYTTTSNYNTAYGYKALYSQTTGGQNTAIGTNALSNNLGGSNNTGVGFGVAESLTSGGDNTALGYYALRLNQTGSHNVAVGLNALSKATTSYNTALGRTALENQTSGSENTAVGFSALQDLTTGSNNVALGMEAGKNNNGGTNVLLGQRAGYTGDGSGNIFIGYQAGYNETGSNLLYIDNSNTASPLIWGDFSSNIVGFNGNVGIGTTSPSTKLDVNGNLNVSGYATASGSLAVGYSSVLAGTGNAGFAGMVGIGTTNPSEVLDVVGDLEVSGVGQFGGITGTAYNAMSDSGTAGYAASDDDLYIEDILEVDGTAYLTTTYFGGSTTYGVSSTGVATLNTTDSVNGLSINSASLTDAVNITMTGYIDMADDQWIGLSSIAGLIEFDDQTTDEVNILNANVGIGTTAPTGLLQVSGTNTGKALAIFNETGTNDLLTASASGSTKLTLANDGNLTIAGNLRLNGNNISNSAGTATITLSSTPTTAVNTLDAGSWLVENTANVGRAALTVNQTIANQDIFTASASGSTKLVITNAGNVGIGTTGPSALLSVGSSSQFQVSSAGAVTAVGVNSGSGLLQGTGGITVTGTGNINATGTSATNIGNSTGALTLASGGTSAWTNTSGNLTLSTATSGTLALTSAGALNLSAGSASTWTLPAVANALNIDANTLTIDALNDRVGIGTTVPGQKLDLVTGSSYGIAGTAVLSGTVLGSGVVTSSLTSVGALASGSIASGFGTISTGNTITTTGTMGTAATTTFTGATGTFSTSTTSPLILGGTAAGSSLSLQSTSGVGTTDYINFKVGNNGATEAIRIIDSGSVGIGTTGPSEVLDIVGDLEVSGVGQFGGITGTAYNAMSDSGTAGLAGSDDDLYIEDILEVDGTAYLTTTYFGGSTTYGVSSTGVATLNTTDSVNGLSINAASITDAVNITMSGDLAVNGNTTIGSGIEDSVTVNADAWTFASDTAITLSGGVNGINFGSNTLSIDAFNTRVGIGTAAPNVPLHLTASDTGDIARFVNTNTSDGTDVLVLRIMDNTPATDNVYINFWNSAAASIGGIRAASSTSVAYVTTGVDYAEYMFSDMRFQKGELVGLDSNNGKIIAGTKNNLVGVISSAGSFVGGFDREDKGAALVALLGQVPAVVDNSNGNILANEPIGASESHPRSGAKQTKAGKIVGVALENFTPNDTACPKVNSFASLSWPEDDAYNSKKPCFKLPGGSFIGKIMVLVKNTWYDPDVYLTDTGDLRITKDTSAVEEAAAGGGNTSEVYRLTDSAGKTITRVGAFAQAAIANLRVGWLEATQIETEKLISPIVYTEQLKAGSVETDEIVIGNQELGISNKEGQTVMKIQENGQTTHFGDLLVQGNTTVSGDITADNGQFNNLTMQQFNNVGDATIAGELHVQKIYAGEIITRKGSFGELLAATVSASTIQPADLSEIERRLEELEERGRQESGIGNPLQGKQELVETTPTTYNLQPTTSPEPTPTPTPDFGQEEATQSAWLSEQASGWPLADPNGDLKITSNLTVLGHTSLAGLTVAGPLSQDGTLIIDNGNSLNVTTGTLYLQNLALGGVDILAGKITIDTGGDMNIEGNLTVKGSLFAQLINPLPGQDLVIDLGWNSQQESQFGKLLVKGIEDKTVASIDAQGNAQFTKVEAQKLVIAADSNSTSEVSPSTSEVSITTNATAGSAILPANETEITIKTPFVTDQTLVYITPTSNTLNKVIYVSAKKSGEYFKVALDTPVDFEIKFNWWIIN